MEFRDCCHIKFTLVATNSSGDNLSNHPYSNKHVKLLIIILTWPERLPPLRRLPCCPPSTRLESCRPTSWSVRWWPGTKMCSPTVIFWCTSTTSCTRASPATTRYGQQLAPTVRLPVVLFFTTRWDTSQTYVMYMHGPCLKKMENDGFQFVIYFFLCDVTQWFIFTC